ncbi:MAG: hypothetical protein ACXVPL_07590 [Actinomycetota bacterium]
MERMRVGRRSLDREAGGRRGVRVVVVRVALVALAMTAVACSKSDQPTGGSATETVGHSPVATMSTGGGQTSTSASTGAELSGTWDGSYDGAYKGTFTLDWQESGTKLTGTIDLPSLGGSVPINGTVAGGTIKFGTVGSTNIQYSGSVSGDSMSGSYKVLTGGGSVGGTWKANRA